LSHSRLMSQLSLANICKLSRDNVNVNDITSILSSIIINRVLSSIIVNWTQSRIAHSLLEVYFIEIKFTGFHNTFFCLFLSVPTFCYFIIIIIIISLVLLIFCEIYTVHVRACEQGVANGPRSVYLRSGSKAYLRVRTIREKRETRISGGIGSTSIHIWESKVITRRDSPTRSLLVQSHLSIHNVENNAIHRSTSELVSKKKSTCMEVL